MDDLNLDFSDMIDPEEIMKSLPADQMQDMSEALKAVKFNFTEEQINALLKDVMAGYQESIKGKPEADQNKMQAALKQYLTSKEMNDRLSKDLQELVKKECNGGCFIREGDRDSCWPDEPVSGVCKGKWNPADRCSQPSGVS